MELTERGQADSPTENTATTWRATGQGRGRIPPVAGGLRAVHQGVLRLFATGQFPAAAELEATAAIHGRTAAAVLADLQAGDYLQLDAGGRISAAYPFSAVPTPHLVTIGAGPQVYAMCAIDALGVAAMLDNDIAIASADPGSGDPVRVSVAADAVTATWEPATAVVFSGRQKGRGPQTAPVSADLIPGPSAEVCCGFMNFFSSASSAESWASAHPQVIGRMLSQDEALELGGQIFGPLLKETGEPHDGTR